MIFDMNKKVNKRYALNSDIFLARKNHSYIFKLEEVDHDNDDSTPAKILLVLERYTSFKDSKEYDNFLSDKEKKSSEKKSSDKKFY